MHFLLPDLVASEFMKLTSV